MPEETTETPPKPLKSLQMLRQSAEDAYYLHHYSITTGQAVPKDISTAIVEFKRLFDRHEEDSITTESELRFSDAYRRLAALMLPVSVESLRDSEDIRPAQEYSFLDRFRLSKVKQVTLLLPLLAIGLIFLIITSEIVQSILLSSLQDITTREARIEAINTELDDIAQQLAPLNKIEQQLTPEEGSSRALSTEVPTSRQTQILDQQSQLAAQLGEKKNRLNEELYELDFDIQARLKNLEGVWRSFSLYPLLFREDDDATTEEDFDPVLAKTKFSIATELLNRLLPIFYGALGAAAYLLRMLIPHIRNRTFNKKHAGSISVRICLGMLSGVAIQWFLINDQQQTQIFERSLSTSALAFLAGYSVDFLFDIMDRFILGLKGTKTTSEQSSQSSRKKCPEEA
jgi:hypothetical protein